MKITVSISHDFETIAAAMAFAAKLEPITAELEAPAPALTAAPAAPVLEPAPAPVAAVLPTTFDEARANAETLNPSLADQLPEVKPSRSRRTKAEMEAARAAEAAATPPAPAPVAAAKPAPVATADDWGAAIEPEPAPAAKPASSEVSEADYKITFQQFITLPDWRVHLPKVLKDTGAERMTTVPADKRRIVVDRMAALIAASV